MWPTLITLLLSFRLVGNSHSHYRGLTTSLGQREFRSEHYVPLKLTRSHAAIPERPKHTTYGRPSTYKTMEEIRIMGYVLTLSGGCKPSGCSQYINFEGACRKDSAVDLSMLLANMYAGDEANSQKAHRPHDKPVAASLEKPALTLPSGRSEEPAWTAGERVTRPKELFKMPRFRNVASKLEPAARNGGRELSTIKKSQVLSN